MNQGWKVGTRLYVYINKRYRKGILKSKNNAKWDFLPTGYSKTRRICPIKNRWHYPGHQLTKWSKKIKILFLNDKPFKLRKESFGHWRGSITGRTKPVAMTVWQRASSATVYVGHLGAFTLAEVQEGKLVRKTTPPTDKDVYYIGRGPLKKTKFKTLKTVSRSGIRMDRIIKKPPLYQIPTRDELGGMYKN